MMFLPNKFYYSI
jgi:hypothetical protein